MRSKLIAGLVLCLCSACSTQERLGAPPDLEPAEISAEYTAMVTPALQDPLSLLEQPLPTTASLWTGERGSLLGDRRAMQRGDILTVVIEIDDSAQISNSSDRSRNGSESLGIGEFLGIPQRIDEALPGGLGVGPGVETNSASAFSGTGSVARNEQLTLRIAATVTDVLPNGVLSIEGQQQVRVNFEMRELLVSGFVRPADVSRQNEITYDKIASARISYGGQGQISDVQQPRWGQQVADVLLPF
jgi:flagellar L-ring protein precursor FlgH